MFKSTRSLRKSRSIGTAVIRHFSGKNESPTNGEGNNGKAPDNSEIPEVPTNCCMSGCANCVWIEYADNLTSKLRGGSELVREIIMKEVQDPNMRAFLEMELRNLANNKKPKS